MKIATHYDTLKVTQDAPVEVIAAAYKALARIYHPDKAGSDAAAMAVMQNINIAYQILSDPQKKAEHDRWIMQQERRSESGGSAKHRRRAPNLDLQAKADKAAAEAAKWKAWFDKAAQEAKEAQERADKAVADLAKAGPGDRAKWETWVGKTAQEAKEMKARADKAAAQFAEAEAAALGAVAEAKGN